MARAIQAQQVYPRYRWVMLALFCLEGFSNGWATMFIAPMAKPLMADFNIGYAALMSIIGASAILSTFFSIPAGLLVDRFGVKRTVLAGVTFAGVMIVLRGFAVNYFQFFVLTLLFGLGTTISMPAGTKLIRGWFPLNQIATAHGLQSTAGVGGMTLGLALTYPLFGFDWKMACWSIGGMMIGAAILWLFLAKEVKVPVVGPLTVRGFGRVVRMPDVWLSGLMMAFNNGSAQLVMGQLPIALETLRFISPAIAGAVASIYSLGAGLVGNMLLPILSDRIGLRKPFLILGAVLGAILTYLIWYSPFGFVTWILALLGGTCAGVIAVISMAVITGHRGIPFETQGAARGVSSAVGSGGRYLLLVLGGYITDWKPDYNATFLAAAIMVLMVLFLALLITETGEKAQVSESARGQIH